jgi:aryl-alcohol dehydrogenase-like predicted oxidoreductase
VLKKSDPMPHPPHASGTGTARFATRMDHLAAGHFRERFGLHFSSIGLGTYLGEPDAGTSLSYVASVQAAVANGCNVLDTAINYRHMQSERDVGRALQELFDRGVATRDELIICSKGGYVAYDSAHDLDSQRDLHGRLIATGLAKADEIAGGVHCLTPAYLSHQIETSLANLGLETIDIYYIHNPEVQLEHGVEPQRFLARLEAAFARLEEEVAAGRIRAYGVASWSGLRADENERNYLPLFRLMSAAQSVGGANHRLRFLQFPYNMGMMEALIKQNQYVELAPHNGEDELTQMALLAAAVQYGMVAITSATLIQGQITGRAPSSLRQKLGELSTDAQLALQLSRSTPGVTTALAGMRQTTHVQENLATAQLPPLDVEEFFRLFQMRGKE